MKKPSPKPKKQARSIPVPRGTVKPAAWSIRLAKTHTANKHSPAGSDGCSDD